MSLPTINKSRHKIYQKVVDSIQRSFALLKPNAQRDSTISKEKEHKKAISNAGYSLNLAQIKQIISACDNLRDKVLIELFAYTGIRRAEATAIMIDDIILDKRLINIRHGKGNKQRLIPLPAEIIKDIKALIDHREDGYLFESRFGKSLSNRQVNRIVSNLGKRAQVNNPNPNYKNITCHLFRHTFARLWKAKQGSIESLSAILGHKLVSTTWNIYGRESMEDIKNNYDKIIKQMYGSLFK